MPLVSGHRQCRRQDLKGIRCPCLAESVNISHVQSAEDITGNEGVESSEGSFDVVILSNGPGEVASWVKPVVRALRQLFGEDRSVLRISVILSPCPHASGQEARLIRQYPEVDRCQEPGGLSRLLFLGQTVDNWDWRKLGVCIFLGGDQFNTLVAGRWLGYKTLVYAEDNARWPGLADMYALRTEDLLQAIPSWARRRCSVVGDLFADAVVRADPHTESNQRGVAAEERSRSVPLVGLLPGSKDAKLSLGVPYFMSVANVLHEGMAGDVRFVLPLAPTVDMPALEAYCHSQTNPMIERFGWSSGRVEPHSLPGASPGGIASSVQSLDSHGEHKGGEGEASGAAVLVTDRGVRVDILSEFPPYDIFRRCSLCLTTVGTNTAELGELGVPMVVVLPTHALEVFRGATGGILGLLSSLPGPLGAAAARAVNEAALRAARFISWPNRWAGEEVVPELVGRVEPSEVAQVARDLLTSPGKLEGMQQRLLSLRGNHSLAPETTRGGRDSSGAAQRIAEQVRRMLRA